MHYFVKPKKILTLSTLTASPLSIHHCIIQLCCDTKKKYLAYTNTRLHVTAISQGSVFLYDDGFG
jgi:hypothetical protein